MSLLRRRVAEGQVALMLLTRLPAGQLGDTVPPMGQTVWAWPLVGALVGALAGAVVLVLGGLGVPLAPLAVAALTVTAGVTGGLHEDGLADVADGFGGGATRERKLEIMRDSRVGSYGVLALVLAVALKLAAMVQAPDMLSLALGCVVLGALSRETMCLPLRVLPPAREDGLGARTQVPLVPSLVGAVLALGLAAVSFGVGGVYLFIAVTVAGLAVTALAKRQIGGQTGDVCGTTQVVTEAVGWCVLAAVWV
ncbi:adenosylcobinamide-GDP ribazoletransferase [Pseudaestuariivita sp.]|uniref:adenosylcobinamide-GDP ribazoletransferase n=1 Tax=Pseudaestuariivita sp. TaxID=2211669 RepID=UPI00405806D2